MIGRGIITNPQLALTYKNMIEASGLDLDKFRSFHNSLLDQYTQVLSGDKPVLHRMKEFWAFWEKNLPKKENEKIIKKIRKSNSINEYKSLVQAIL